jgi:hypothetical protein
MRTVRIPEDKKNYELPPDLGIFPMFDIRPFSEKLPPSMVAQGGLFLPMYRESYIIQWKCSETEKDIEMEAMWINFDCIGGAEFIIRPFLGGVNGITGESLVGDMGTLLRKMNRHSPQQDYLVLPDQKWLDGISTAPGVVKQFVAAETAPPRSEKDTPRNHQTSYLSRPALGGWSSSSKLGKMEEQAEQIGASVEWQVTGRDSTGGIQLQIIPTFNTESMSVVSQSNMTISSSRPGFFDSYDSESASETCHYDVLKTPKELGLRDGDVIHIKDLKTQKPKRSKKLIDLFQESSNRLLEDRLNIQINYYDNIPMSTFLISVPGSSSAPVPLKVIQAIAGIIVC